MFYVAHKSQDQGCNTCVENHFLYLSTDGSGGLHLAHIGAVWERLMM